MKKTIWGLLFLGLIGTADINAQQTEAFCGMDDDEQQQKVMGKMSSTTFLRDGLHLTANGELNILLVFVRFPGDDLDLQDGGAIWWAEDDDPTILNSIIDANTSVGSTNKYNLTHYFKEMSLDSYDVVGNAISVEAPKTASQYNNYVGRAAKDVIEYISDNNLAYFDEYDNWEAQGSGTNIEDPDSLVDMIVMIYKGDNFTQNMGDDKWGGCADLDADGCPGDSENQTELAVNNGKKVKFGFEAGNGSGVTTFASSDVRVIFNIITHEIAHWLLGSGHPYYDGGNSDSRVASLLSATFTRSMSVNASEQERLGWNTVPEITSDIRDTVLTDFLTTGAAFKYKVPPRNPPDPYNNEYYYFENHQNISKYDDATHDPDDKGIFILHTEYAIGNTHNIRYLVSDGDWKWENVAPYTISDPCCGTVPLLTKVEPDRDYGRNFMAKMLAFQVDGKYHWLHGYKDEDGNSDVQGYYRGKENSDMKSTYNINYGTIFASHANPLPENMHGDVNDFAMLIKGENNGILTVDFIINYDPYTITENTTWDGQIFLEQTTNIENNATLTILPGTTVYLSENVILRAKPGAKIIAEGTEQEPIHFKRADPDKEWNKIDLRSSAGNSFEWVVFDGGDKNVDIASKNNTFKHITSRNGWRGISGWHNADGSGNASAEISYALIEDNTSVGVVSHYLDLDMSYTTIRNNAQAGLYISSNTVYPFHHNVVTGNGQVQTYRDGIEVTSSGTLYLQAGNLGRGYNEIFNNPDDQISGSGDMYLGMLYPGSGGFNSIRGNYSGSKYLVDNNSGVTVASTGEPLGKLCSCFRYV